MAFDDIRTQAELLLAPKLPVSRSLVNFSSLKLNFGGSPAPGVISNPTQLAGPLRTALGGSLANKQTIEGLAGSVNTVIANFDATAAALKSGTFIPPAPVLIPTANGVPNVASFFSFSSLKPGQSIPANFDAVIANRKSQLQQLSKTFSSVFSQSSFSGVAIVENTNPKPFPLPDQIDLPSLPRLAQGGPEAAADAILKDKIKFVVQGVNIGSGKPSSWTRDILTSDTLPLNVNPVVNQTFRDRKNQSGWSEPPTPYNAQFPYNRVQQSASGHVIEIDDTPGAERLHIFHRSGSFIEWHPDGTVVYKNMKDGYAISMADHYVKVNGKCHVAVDGGVTLYSKGNIDIQSDGDINVQTKGDFNVYAKNINMRSKNTFKADGTEIDLRYINLPTALTFITPLGGGPAIVPRMNIAAAAADFPDFPSLDTLKQQSDAMGSNPDAGGVPINLGAAKNPPPVESPLSNFSVYKQMTPRAVAYRAKLFDTPEEVQDFELYSAHTDLQQQLHDFPVDENPRQLGGTLRSA